METLNFLKVFLWEAFVTNKLFALYGYQPGSTGNSLPVAEGMEAMSKTFTLSQGVLCFAPGQHVDRATQQQDING